MVVENIRKINPSVLIIVSADKISEEKLIEHGIDEFVLTPFSAENLADKILMMLAKRELKKIKEKTT